MPLYFHVWVIFGFQYQTYGNIELILREVSFLSIPQVYSYKCFTGNT